MRSDRYKDNGKDSKHAATEAKKHAATGKISKPTDSTNGSSPVPANNAKKRKKKRGLKVLAVLILLLAAAIAGTVAYSYKTTEDSLDVQFSEEEISVEVGEECSSMDYVEASVGEVTPSTAELDTSSIGTKAVVYTATMPMYGGLLTPTKEFTLRYTVVDKTPPLVLWSGDGTVLQRGTEFDIKEVVGYGDNIDPKPAVKVDGEVDMQTNGSYPLHVTVTDASGNSVDWKLTVKVADSVPTYTDNSPRTAFGDFASAHKGDSRSFGIDVSVWQGDINWEQVKAAGCDFAFIRIGYSSEGEVTEDSKFAQNIKGAQAAGVKTGVYLYSSDNNEEDVRKSVRWIKEHLGGARLDLPVVFDWEDFGRFQNYEMSFADLNALYDAFADELANGTVAAAKDDAEAADTEAADSAADGEATTDTEDADGAAADDTAATGTVEAAPSYDAMLYSSKNPLEKVWEETDTRPIWLAHYTDKTDYKGPYKAWQASCTGRIDGIDGDVDMDILYY